MLLERALVKKLDGRPEYSENCKQYHQHKDDDQKVFEWSQISEWTVFHASSFNE